MIHTVEQEDWGVPTRGKQIIRVRNSTRPRFKISVHNAPRLRGLRPQRNASAKKISESAIFREIFRVFREFFRVFRVFSTLIRGPKNFIKI